MLSNKETTDSNEVEITYHEDQEESESETMDSEGHLTTYTSTTPPNNELEIQGA